MPPSCRHRAGNQPCDAYSNRIRVQSPLVVLPIMATSGFARPRWRWNMRVERRWNQALTTEVQLKAELVTFEQHRERPLTDAQKRELLAFGRDLSKLRDV
jgi:hypothetical protein